MSDGDSDGDAEGEQWLELRDLFAEEPLVPARTECYHLELGQGLAPLRIQPSVRTFARQRKRRDGESIGAAIGEAGGDPMGFGADAARLTGALLWDSSVVIADYLIRHHSQLLEPNSRCVELGCGLSLPGLVAARLGYRVVLTDRVEVLPLARSSAALNGLNQSVRIAPLCWGNAAEASAITPPKVDCLLLADTLYEEELCAPLVQTLLDLSDPTTLILLAYDTAIGRWGAYDSFWECAKSAGFKAEPLEQGRAMSAGSTQGGHPASDANKGRVKEAVLLYRLSLADTSTLHT